ncbi:hypothetical protein AMK59_8069 [Oryctes borbonicus]|uniref:Uncharacterized protein n=1 Tax=Oryctes borbonicus TaxID=1629725 RepID=A0A0T6AUA0_9SCAR|nr:hypothetical protein AMK59_8069 [Oryctes borbonicus]
MLSNEEFGTVFQSFDNNIPEKRRRFNSLIKELDCKSRNSEDLSNLILSVTPKNTTEELLRIEFVIHFKLDNILINELKHNNSTLIKKLLKNRKVFGDLFSNINPQFFVNDIFPHLSHSMKLKLLHGISKSVSNENLVDQYFTEVEKIYGLKLAMSLLQGCTPNLIRDRFKRCSVKLYNGQLMHIVKKDKEFFMYYFEFLKEELCTNYQYFYYFQTKTVRALAKMHPDMYWKVNDKHNLGLRFGKRLTATMFRHRSKELKGHEFLNFSVNLHQLYKVARKDGQLREFLFDLFPLTFDDYINTFSWYSILSFLECFPYGEPFTLISSIFKEKYGKNLLDNPEYCKNCLQIIPTQQRKPIIDILIKDDEELVSFYSPAKSIPILKGKLQHCADREERGRLTSLLCKTCKVNNDKDALLQILDYILERHKNDIVVLTVFFNNFMHYPGTTKLDVVCWQKITDIIKIFQLTRPDFDVGTFYQNYLKHLIQKGIPLEEYCKKRLQDMFNGHSYVSAGAFNFPLSNKYKKIYLEEMGKYIHIYKGHKHYQTVCITFLHGIICLNQNNKKFTLELKNYSHLFDQIRTTECYTSNAIVLHNLKAYPSDEIWHDLFWKILQYIQTNSILAWYVQKWPERIAPNIDKIFNEMEFTSIQIFLKKAKRCLDQDTLEKLKMYALNATYNEDYDKIKLAVAILCIITPKTLLDIIIPLITSIDSGVNVKLPKHEFLLVKFITKRLHKLGNPSEILPLIITCSSQNCAKYALIPLISIACHSPEIYMRSELPKFTDKKLCMKKNVLFLSKLLFPSHVFAEVLQLFNEKETDVSIKKTIVQKAFECLNENPSEFFWSFFKKCIISMDKANASMYDLLLDVTKVPQQYLSEYILFVFEEISNNPYLEIRKNRFKFLENIPAHIIENLSIDFLKGIIQESACLENVSNFHWKCAFFVKGVQQEELLKENIRTLKSFIESNHLSLNKNRKVRIAINSFISRFLDVALEMKENYNPIKIFCTLWNLEIKLNDCHKYIVVLLTELYFRNDSDAFKTGIDTRSLLQEYVEKAGPSIIKPFFAQLNEFLLKIDCGKENRLYRFVEGLFADSSDENTCTLIIYIFSMYPPKPQSHDNYFAIFQTLLKSDNSIIKFHLNQFGYIC